MTGDRYRTPEAPDRGLPDQVPRQRGWQVPTRSIAGPVDSYRLATEMKVATGLAGVAERVRKGSNAEIS